ncbi:MAG: nucleotidyltransferase domain-containing protein [Clostridia bacterium]|nr:nucleotidyltransferase domain-containing protein [Clostridia bacterium]
MQINESEKTKITEFIVEKVSPYAIFLFGSGAKGSMTPESDIDIAFLSDSQFTDYEIFMMAQELAAKLGREVDLIDLGKASTVFKAQVVGTGKIIYDGDINRRRVFQMRTLKEYAMLNEERQHILDKFIERSLQ